MGTAKIWKVSDDELTLLTVVKGTAAVPNAMASIAFPPDGSGKLVIGLGDGNAYIWGCKAHAPKTPVVLRTRNSTVYDNWGQLFNPARIKQLSTENGSWHSAAT